MIRSVPKPRRLLDPGAVQAAKKPWCEVCGSPSRGIEPHHILTRGAGGPDHKYNLIQLCWECHYGRVPAGQLPPHYLFEIVARREGKTVEEIEEMVYRLRCGDELKC